MFFRIITLVVFLWIIVPEQAYAQKDSIVYQLRLGGEFGWVDGNVSYNISSTGVWYPTRAPIRLEVMAGAGLMDNCMPVYLLGARVSAPLFTRVVGVHIGAIFVKPASQNQYLKPPYIWEPSMILETNNIMDALCAEWGVSLLVGSKYYMSFSCRQSFKMTVAYNDTKHSLWMFGIGMAYIFEW
jgi:hypothetical protein